MIVFDPRYLPDCRLKKSAVNQRLSSLLREERSLRASSRMKRGAVLLASIMGATSLVKLYASDSEKDGVRAQEVKDLRILEAQYLSCVFTEISCIATFRRTVPHLVADQVVELAKDLRGGGEKVHIKCLDMLWPYLRKEGRLPEVFSD